MYTGTPVIDTFWGTGEPSSLGEDCMDLLKTSNFSWNDDGCDRNDRGYICQIGMLTKQRLIVVYGNVAKL